MFTVAVAIGVIKAAREPALASIKGPTGLTPSAVQVTMAMGEKIDATARLFSTCVKMKGNRKHTNRNYRA